MAANDQVMVPIQDEATEIAAEVGCFGAMIFTIKDLRGLVASAPISEQSRERLIVGLNHIETHLCTTVQLLRADRAYRRN